jgi:hypothetical protein
MGKLFDRIDDKLRDWIGKQALFFVGTAPLSADGHVNVSPKGPIGSLRVLDDRTIAYLDVIGSGAETIAHLRENGRIVIMLCAFAGPPRIVRLHGRGEAVLANDPRFAELLDSGKFEDAGVAESRRAIIVVSLDRISDSCGYGVPLMAHRGQRSQMFAWGEKKLAAGGQQALDEYVARKNATSIDGLPAIERSNEAE